MNTAARMRGGGAGTSTAIGLHSRWNILDRILQPPGQLQQAY